MTKVTIRGNPGVRILAWAMSLAILLGILLCWVPPADAKDIGNTKTVVKQFYADSPDDKYGFETTRTIGGKTYTLAGEKYKVLRKSNTDARQMDAISGNRTAFTAGKTFMLDKKTYVVQNVKTKTESVQETLAVKSASDAPAELTRTYHDKETNLNCKLTYALDKVQKTKKKSWTGAGTFTINLVGYGGPYYDIGTTKLSGKNTLKDIQSKQKAVLEAQGLDSSKTRISGVEWNGKAYIDDNGNPCRDVVVSVQTQDAPMTAVYTADLYRFSIDYVPEGSKPVQYLMQGTAIYAPVSSRAGWTRIVLTIVIVIGVMAIGFFLWYLWKEYKLMTSGKEIRTIDGVRYTEDDF